MHPLVFPRRRAPYSALTVAALLASANAHANPQDNTPDAWLRHCSQTQLLCSADGDCPSGETCDDRNRLRVQVAIDFEATPAELAFIETFLTDASAALFDATDGQFQLSVATITNDAPANTRADIRILPDVCTVGPDKNTSKPCSRDADCAAAPDSEAPYGKCGTSPVAGTNKWQDGGVFVTSIGVLDGTIQDWTEGVFANLTPGRVGAHELAHLLFGVRDEYEHGKEDNVCPNLPTPYDPHGETPPPPGPTVALPLCLMSRPDPDHPNHNEFCWGQGWADGDHDAAMTTVQSTFHGHSCWEQVGVAFPDVTAVPAGAPDLAANGATMEPLVFQYTTVPRVVMVLDESGSMSADTPTRMEQLQEIAQETVALATDTLDLGIVSFSTDTTSPPHADVPVGVPLAGQSAPWVDAIDGLTPNGHTNITAGLARASEMLLQHGAPIGGRTSILLLTDGLHNAPAPQSVADGQLTALLEAFAVNELPVNVTCLGQASGLDGQCARIAKTTRGSYTSSTNSVAYIDEAFIGTYAQAVGQHAVASCRGSLDSTPPLEVLIDAETRTASFAAMWNTEADAEVLVYDPKGLKHTAPKFGSLAVLRVEEPLAGTWTIEVEAEEPDPRVVVRAYSDNRIRRLVSRLVEPIISVESPFVLELRPSERGQHLSSAETYRVEVVRPDGTTAQVEMDDQGPDGGGADAEAGDGLFTATYADTGMPGAYAFRVPEPLEKLQILPGDFTTWEGTDFASPFQREASVTGVVLQPVASVGTPEDDTTLASLDGDDTETSTDVEDEDVGPDAAEADAPGCGCRSSDGTGSGWLLGLLAVALTRRRRRRYSPVVGTP